MSLRFHAAPPGGWLNDPNGLIRTADGWTLFAQHAADAPDFRLRRWARFESSDGLNWRFGGVSVDEPETWSAYSGCIRERDDVWDAWLTRHEEATRLESQWRRTSVDRGKTWSAPTQVIPPRLNLRDPFLVDESDGARLMLLAAPCDWTNWESDPPSRLLIFREKAELWVETGVIGPWSPAGVMWEVPALQRTPHGDLLIISLLDRRGGASTCSVRAWAGRLDARGFERRSDWPAEGVRVDHGPDFYAAIPSTPTTACQDHRWVAWASSWATARRLPWPGFSGGPITAPRRLTVATRMGSADGLALHHALADGFADAFSVPCAAVPMAGRMTAGMSGLDSFLLELGSDAGTVEIAGDPRGAGLTLRRAGADWLIWRSDEHIPLQAVTQRALSVLVDGPMIEIFVEPDGLAATFALPNQGAPFQVTLEVNGRPTELSFAGLLP